MSQRNGADACCTGRWSSWLMCALCVGSNCCGQRSPSSPRRPAPRAQGTDVLAYKTQIKEKEGKINELVEELGNKELLLSEAQASLSKVGGRVLGFGG